MALCHDEKAAAAAAEDLQDADVGRVDPPTLALVGSSDWGYSPSESADAQLNAGRKGAPVSKEVRHALPKGFSLHEYRIEGVLGDGGFGITYLAEDANLGKRVAIKEYLPGDLAIRQESEVLPKSTTAEEDFLWGLNEFLREAQTLAQFEHPNIVPVLRFFEANGTAYIVMAFQEGDSLFDVIVRKGTLDQKTLEKILTPLLDGLEQVHNLGFLHRDIKPENIYIRSNGSPVLLDFGAARQALGTKTRTLTSIVSRGFAPFEQYTRTGKQGPWTDIYGLGAVLYMAITGDAPPDSTDRIETDQMEPVASLGRGRYSESFLRAVDAALAVRADDRPQTLAEWRAMLLPQAKAEPAARPIIPRPDADTLRPGSAAKDRAARPAAKRRTSPALVVGGLAALLVVGAGAAAILSTGSDEPGIQQAASEPAEKPADTEQPEQAAGQPEIDAETARRKAAEEEARRRLDEQAKREAEAKQKAEADRRAQTDAKAKAAAEAKQKAEADRKAQADAKAKAAAEAEARARIEAEARQKVEAEQRAKAATEAKRKTEAAKRAKIEAEVRAKVDAEQRAKAAADAKRNAEAAAKAKAAAQAKAAADAQARAQAQAAAAAKAKAAAQAKQQTQQAALPPAAAPSNSLREMFAGSTVYKKKSAYPPRDDVWQFRPDGTLRGSYSQPYTSQLTSPEVISDTGSWSVAGNKLCLQWRGWDGGKKVCYAISGTGKNLVASGGGLLNGRFTLAR